MRRNGTFVRNCTWRQLITLGCLIAFVFVAAVHAGHHLVPLGEKIVTFSTASAPSDNADEGELAGTDSVCLICALAAAELPTVDLATSQRIVARVELPVFKLTTRSIPAEFPPPIS